MIILTVVSATASTVCWTVVVGPSEGSGVVLDVGVGTGVGVFLGGEAENGGMTGDDGCEHGEQRGHGPRVGGGGAIPGRGLARPTRHKSHGPTGLSSG